MKGRYLLAAKGPEDAQGRIGEARRIVRSRVLKHDIVGEGEPLVLLPGGLTGSVSWIPHQERLSATRRMVRIQPIHNELLPQPPEQLLFRLGEQISGRLLLRQEAVIEEFVGGRGHVHPGRQTYDRAAHGFQL